MSASVLLLFLFFKFPVKKASGFLKRPTALGRVFACRVPNCCMGPSFPTSKDWQAKGFLVDRLKFLCQIERFALPQLLMIKRWTLEVFGWFFFLIIIFIFCTMHFSPEDGSSRILQTGMCIYYSNNTDQGIFARFLSVQWNENTANTGN